MARNEAWVSVGWDHDTPAFAVASIRHWWHQMGCGAYPEATTLFITADAGGRALLAQREARRPSRPAFVSSTSRQVSQQLSGLRSRRRAVRLWVIIPPRVFPEERR